MAPSAIAEVRGYLAGLDLSACHRAAHAAINASSGEEAREQVTQILGN
jgi:phosphoenolpyruvate-protein kinase (PTS system EI component)